MAPEIKIKTRTEGTMTPGGIIDHLLTLDHSLGGREGRITFEHS